MAQETVGIKIEVQGGESIGNLKKDLKEANLALIQAQKNFGDYSKEAIAAAQKVAGLKDSIQEAKETADLFDPGKKFQAFTGVLTSVAGGISAVQGAFGLLGAEGEQVQKALLKVQSALALSQGLSTIKDSAKDFQRLNAIIQSTAIFQKANNAATAIAITLQKAFGVATVGTGRAFTILKGAIAATGIGLLVVGLTTLIGKISEWTSASEKAAEAQKKLAEQNDVVNASLQNQIDVLTAVGNKEKEILALKKQQIDNELNVLRTSAKAKGELTLDELKKFRDLKTQKEVLDIEEQNRLKKIDEEAKKKQDDKNKDAAEKAKALREKRKQENDEILQDQKDAAQNIRDLQDEIFLQSIEDETQRALVKLSQDKERQINEINLTKATAEQKQQQIKLIEDKFKQEKDAIEKEDAEKRREKEQKDAEELTQKRNESLAKEREFLEAQKKEREEFQRADLEATKELQERKFQAVNAGLDLVGSLAGKNEAIGNVIYTIQKAIEIGRIITSTTSAIAQIKAQTAAIPAILPPGIPNKAFFAALAIGTKKIAGLKIGAAANIATIVGSSIAKFKGGAGGGSIGGTDQTASVGGVGSAGAPVSPQLPEAQLTQLDQTSINRLGSATNRSYVLESDVTNSQERITRINRAARLN